MAEDTTELIVETQHLTKIYQNRQIALNDVSLTIEPGCVLGLLGPNGAGKTTFLRLILGLHRPTAGWAKVFGQVMTPNAADLRRRIGYIPTNPQFPKGMTPITYLDYIARLFGIPGDVRKPKLATLIRAVDLLPHSGDSIAHFTPGMTARLAVAASLINEPDLLIWDEPTHGLDIEARRSMLELIKTLAAEKTLIISQPQPDRRGRGVQPRLRAEQGAADLPRLAARPEGPHPQEPLRARPRRRPEVDHQGGRRCFAG